MHTNTSSKTTYNIKTSHSYKQMSYMLMQVFLHGACPKVVNCMGLAPGTCPFEITVSHRL
jgi:hypothetical protein